MRTFKDGLRLAYFYTSSVVGAGFISGREVANHFAAYDEAGFCGIIVASAVMGIFAAALMLYVYKYRKCSYSEFITNIFGRKFGFVLKTSAALFMLVILSAMASGAGEIIAEIFPLGFILPRVIFLVVCFLCVGKNSSMLCKISSLLCPVMMIGIIIICMAMVAELPQLYKPINMGAKNNMWLFSALCWCSYNVITLPSVMFGVKDSVRSGKASLTAGIISFFIIFVFSLFIYFPEMLFYGRIARQPLPLAYLCAYMDRNFQYAYLLIFLCAVFTTAISVLNALCRQIESKMAMPWGRAAFMLCAAAFSISFFGFYDIVGNFYIFFAAVGFLMLVVMLFLRIFFPLSR